MSSAIDLLLGILDLEVLEHNLFRGRSPQSGWQRVFGGQVIGQALVAAARTIEIQIKDAAPLPTKSIHSLHCYFMLPGDPNVPIIYQVERLRDGGHFSTRRVVAIQHGKAIFALAASFHAPEDGLEHQVDLDMRTIPQPEDLPSEAELKAAFINHVPEPIRQYWERERPLEMRSTEMSRYITRDKRPPQQYVWIKASSPLPDDPRIHEAVLAYASDFTLLDTSLITHGRTVFDRHMQSASLDHALWFHRPFRADDWLLYAQDSPSAFGARGFSRGSIYTRSGTLIASVAQEGLIRLRHP